jgi:hypothetical protein
MSQLISNVSSDVVMLQRAFESQANHKFIVTQQFTHALLVGEPLFITTVVFILLTVITALLYYRRIRQASRAYEDAQNAVSDIVISFNRQLNRQEKQVGATIQKVEAQAARTERLSGQLDEQEDRITTGLASLKAKVEQIPDTESVKIALENLQAKVEGLTKAQEEWQKRAAPITESQIEAVIPLRREQALAPLTDTELRVLDFIAISPQGERTAPEVKEMIKLTREHTARLMKKLYQGGYLERRTDKAPYAYRVKEEMLKILKKSETKA